MKSLLIFVAGMVMGGLLLHQATVQAPKVTTAVNHVFGLGDQLTLLQFMPAEFAGEGDGVASEFSRNGFRRAVVGKDLQAGDFSSVFATKWSTALTSASVTSKTSVISFTGIPASRFSKIVWTGMRVPRSTQAPLIVPGTLSTASHWDQSILWLQF